MRRPSRPAAGLTGVSFDQNVPLGPVDRRQVTRRHWLRRRRPQPPRLFDTTLLSGLLGLLLAAGGVYLGTVTPRVEVSVTPSAYSIEGVTLTARGDGVYQGSAGVVVLRDQGHVLRGAASATTQGLPMVARCQGVSTGSERCAFQVGSRTLHAVDTWHAGSWSRAYDDGKRVILAVRQGTPVPVPVPVDA